MCHAHSGAEASGDGDVPIDGRRGVRANMAHARQSSPDYGLGLSHFSGKSPLEYSHTPQPEEDVPNLRTTTSQKCAAVPRRARMQGS